MKRDKLLQLHLVLSARINMQELTIKIIPSGREKIERKTKNKQKLVNSLQSAELRTLSVPGCGFVLHLRWPWAWA